MYKIHPKNTIKSVHFIISMIEWNNFEKGGLIQF